MYNNSKYVLIYILNLNNQQFFSYHLVLKLKSTIICRIEFPQDIDCLSAFCSRDNAHSSKENRAAIVNGSPRYSPLYREITLNVQHDKCG